MAERLLAFVPAYNCAAQIGRVLEQFASPPGERIAEILVLDNGSRDGTVEAAIAAAARFPHLPIRIARNRANYGLGGSHKAAFAYAEREGFSHVVVLHGDDQGRLADLAPVLDAGLHHRADACLGARFAPGAQLEGYASARIAGNRAFNALFTLVTGARVWDLGSGLNLFSRAVFADPAVTRWSDDLRFNVYLLLDLLARGVPIHWFPISWREEDQLSNVRIVSQAARTLRMLGAHALSPAGFHAADHRAVAHEGYAFDVVR